MQHPDVDSSVSSLASLYRDQGNYEQAEKLFMLAMSIRDNTLGKKNPMDPMLAAGLRELAEVRIVLGKFVESQPLLERSLLIEENFVGKESPLLAVTLINLARVHLNQQHYSVAEQLLKRTLAIQEKSLGAEHVSLAPTLTTLAEVLRQSGRAAEAESLDTRAQELRAKQSAM